MAMPPDIYVHVPKAGGTSLRRSVFEHYGARRVYIYSKDPPTFVRGDDYQAWHVLPEDARYAVVRKTVDMLPGALVRGLLELGALRYGVSQHKALSKAAAIIGHFPVNAFTDVLPEDARRLTIVRDPLTRMASHYRYLQQLKGLKTGPRNWMEGQDPELAFYDFALSEPVQNFQTQYTGTEVSHFAVVGITEKLGSFLVAAGLSMDPRQAPHINKTAGEPLATPMDPGFLRDFQEFHSQDYLFYESVREHCPGP
jgi:hypothetical protein